MFNIFIKKFSTLILICLSTFSAKNKFVRFLFDFFKKNSSEFIYFISYKNKNKILNYLKQRQEIEKKELFILYKNLKVDNEMSSVLNDLNKTGISKNLNIDITDEEINSFVDEMNRSHYYDNHVPYKKDKKDPKIKPNGPYKSYDYSTQLNNSTLLKICLNEKILKVAQNYLGVIPRIFSINTFNTLPGKKAFTHDFHRDIDNLKWLVIFVYWTDTSENNGAFEQIKFTHKPSIELEKLLNVNPDIFSSNFDKFFKNSIGYGKNDKYIELFKNEINSIYGSAGKIVACDTLGLHRGTPVKNERLVTWIRYGVMESRQKILNNEETLNRKIKLTDENMEILNKSKFKDVLSDLVEIN